MIEVDISEKRYPDRGEPVLASLEFSVRRGEVVAVIGPSGVGKSTLLHLISGLDTDYSGSIKLARIHGREARIGYMFQDPRLMSWLTALENVCLVAGGRRGRQAALSALQAVGLADCAHSYPNRLSGGMRRRVALARAFVSEPDLLLMDEPFVSLDEPTARRLRQLFVEMWQEKRPAVLFVTHNLDEAIATADRLLFLGREPATLMLDTPVPIDRPGRVGLASLAEYKRELLARHPNILTGQAMS